MSYIELSSKKVRPRKPRMCEWCAERIEKGELCHYRAISLKTDFNLAGCTLNAGMLCNARLPMN